MDRRNAANTASTTESRASLLDGDRIGRFEVRGFLGRGAVGAVYRVFDPELGREVALKTLLRASAEEIYHLKQEFRSVASLVHPNLVRLFELFVEEENCFFTMELVNGVPLDEYVRGVALRARSSGVESRGSWRSIAETGELSRERLDDALPQVVAGLCELHASGRVHRDLKPSNVLVDRRGRVVILDFGFAVAWRASEALPTVVDDVAGTLPYMAPEQLFGGRVSPASDWYSFGAMMYELLLGEPVFAGNVVEIAPLKTAPLGDAAKRRIGEEYGALVAGLLEPDASRRPDAKAVLARLGSSSNPGLSSTKPSARLVGREAELAKLEAALARTTSERSAFVVTVEGGSGIGKSELLRHFLARHTAVHVAVGRSRPQEAVSYNAFDGAMDALSQLLTRTPQARREAFWPQQLPALLKLFPVLERACPVGLAKRELQVEPSEERRLAFVALRDLLGRFTAEQPLILCLDDVQWGDRDSSVLLASLLNPPLEAAVLIVLAYRSEDLSTSVFLKALEQNVPSVRRAAIALSPLSESESLGLARELLAAYGHQEEANVASLVREAGGSPFFVEELARNVVESGNCSPAGSATDVIGLRLARLSAPDRLLLETIAAAGQPLSQSGAIEASGSSDVTRVDLARLCDLRWLRQVSSNNGTAVEPYHDRLRERIVAGLVDDPQRLRGTHRRIAATFDKPDADPEFLAFHYEAAADLPAAARCAIAAAERANAGLAFQNAADLFLRAAKLGSKTHSKATLLAERGEALKNAGLELEAARSFEAAAASLDRASDTVQWLELRRRAGEHYLRTAHYDEGLAITDEVLKGIGTTLPRTHGQALLPALSRRVRFLFRGHDFTPRERHDVDDEQWRRLEVLWSAGISLAILDYQRADPIALQHLLDALEHGDCAQALRALAYEASVQGGIGGSFLRERSAKMQSFVFDLAEARGVPYERAWARLAIGSCGWFAGKWRRCVTFCDDGAAIFREQCRGVPWEIATLELFSLSALGIMGDIEELERRLPLAIRAAEEKGDLFALNNCRLGQPSILWLATNRVSELRRLAAEADSSMWKGGYYSHRYHHLLAVAQADLFEGDAWSCLDRLAVHWPGLKGSRILYLEWPQIELKQLRARAWLLAAKLLRDGARVPGKHAGLRFEALLRSVRREAKAIAKHSIRPAAALSTTLSSSAAALGGGADATALRERARAACHRADMQLMARLLAGATEQERSLCQALGIH